MREQQPLLEAEEFLAGQDNVSQERLDEPDLTVPHPHLHERLFVLEPLAELDPALEVPGKGLVSDLLAGIESPP